MDEGLEDERLEDRRPEAGQERRSRRDLDALRTGHEVSFRWVRGHAGHPLNDRVDALALAAIAPFRKRRGGGKPG